MEADHEAMLVRIYGRVQGVNYRVWTRTEAEKLGLTGWVRNESDGTVTAFIAGPERTVQMMLKHFWEGPMGASVSGVTSEKVEARNVPDTFVITH